MSNGMYQKLIYSFLIIFLLVSCSKKDPEVSIPPDKEKSFEIYKEAVDAMDKGNYLFASKKFTEAEAILPQMEFSAKAALMSSYCLYLINFYDKSLANLERFIKQYPADVNIAYAHYLIALSSYEQILDQKKDIEPLLESKKKNRIFYKKISQRRVCVRSKV